MYDRIKLPELLCPAGSVESLDAAIQGGADAVYLGGTQMNARMHAGNFDPLQLREAVRRAHTYGVKVYLTLNTLVTDRELSSCLSAAIDASRAGVDALIVADAGAASMIHRVIPGLELHASTQMSGHNSLMGAELKSLGFSRMVVAREISEKNLTELMQNSPIETELFVHGALCMSHSGQCLFSSLVGGRSGNRGECAQPCRLPYACTGCQGKGRGGKEDYPLSLKDLSLCLHVPKLIELGVSSLKIEGRMKSPEYVYYTARVWRRLLDERRAAMPQEMREMADAFSRNGFTDGYFTSRVNASMLGIRRASDKQASEELKPFEGLQRKLPLALECSVRAEEPVRLTLTAGGHTVTEEGDLPQPARTAPMDEAAVIRSLSRFGGTPFEVTTAKAEVEEGLMIPVSRLNDLRRRATEALSRCFEVGEREERAYVPNRPRLQRERVRSARFYSAEQITPSARSYFDCCFLPLHRYDPVANGVALPPVIFDGDIPEVRRMLKQAHAQGATHALVGNLGHLALVRESGLIPVGDLRLNACNGETVALYESLGVEELVLSPELTLPQLRDAGGNSAAVVYGRIPLMLMEKCAVKDRVGCEVCHRNEATLIDRKGVAFPVLREWEHRNVVYNSLPTCMSDREEQLIRNRLQSRHFIFTVESPEEVDRVIECHRSAKGLGGAVRRIGV